MRTRSRVLAGFPASPACASSLDGLGTESPKEPTSCIRAWCKAWVLRQAWGRSCVQGRGAGFLGACFLAVGQVYYRFGTFRGKGFVCRFRISRSFANTFLRCLAGSFLNRSFIRVVCQALTHHGKHLLLCGSGGHSIEHEGRGYELVLCFASWCIP